ncbi:DUF1381 domain-containing protein [Staphylococcus hominis]|uniref:DUF1381 domain-containing protein n=1 Tax=Staphylococcus hominis TaxID=1290 RepID=UPI00143E551B|nr:DUF1381 domain-containing protein [Staphylococcus hominis]QIY36450.1 DUF1381 domain-containing protein [Staphylococcus hominis]
MKQFLIRGFTDSTGYVHRHVEQPRENERMTLVEAEDKEEAKEKANSYYTNNSKVSSYKVPEDKTLKSLFGGK